jgi:xanthine phosphoribosyltransferase
VTNKVQQYLMREGKVLSEQVIKVNSFLNHQVHPVFIRDVGQQIADEFQNASITKVLTIEASGIHIAFAVALALGVPFVYAKKSKAITQSGVYASSVYSFTRQTEYQITVSKEFISSDDKVLIVDDILAEGAGVRGLLDILEQAKASLVAISVVIEKSFQSGRKFLDDAGYPVFALARIAKMAPETGIQFLDESR